MVLAPFDRGLSGQEKTTLVHGKTNTELIFGTKAGKLLRCHPNWRKCARSATCHHTSFPGNGGKARRTLPPHGVSSALRSPSSETVSAAITPTGSSLGKTQTLAYSSASVVCCFELGASIRPRRAICQAGKCTFSAFHKRGRPHARIFRHLNTKRRKETEKFGCFSHFTFAKRRLILNLPELGPKPATENGSDFCGGKQDIMHCLQV